MSLIHDPQSPRDLFFYTSFLPTFESALTEISSGLVMILACIHIAS